MSPVNRLPPGLRSAAVTRPAGQSNLPDGRRRGLRRGFTLIELLTVIAIICMLVAITAPTLHQVVKLTRITVCAANVHQLCVATANYAADSRAWLPYRDANHRPAPNGYHVVGAGLNYTDHRSLWVGYLSGYSVENGHDVLFCPSVSYDGLAETNQGWPTHWWNCTWYNSSYAYYANYNTAHTAYAKRFTEPFGRLTDPGAKNLSLFSDIIRRDWIGCNTANHGVGRTVVHMADTPPAGANCGKADGSVHWHDFTTYEDDTDANEMTQYLSGGNGSLGLTNGFWAGRH